MTPNSLLETLQARGIQLRAEQGLVRVRAPKGELTKGDHALIKEHRDALYHLLMQASESEPKPPVILIPPPNPGQPVYGWAARHKRPRH